MFHFEYSKGSPRLGRISDLLYENIRLTGRQPIKLRFAGWSEESDLRDVTIRGLYHNGERVTALPESQLIIGDFCRNITIE